MIAVKFPRNACSDAQLSGASLRLENHYAATV